MHIIYHQLVASRNYKLCMAKRKNRPSTAVVPTEDSDVNDTTETLTKILRKKRALIHHEF